MKGKHNSWKDVKVTLFGREITSITSVEFKRTLEELQADLQEAEENENYELCVKFKNQIDNYGKKQ
ncbi:hypothetical protein [Flavobacterium laiguense]|uniref:Uncharacterized protein n=1 Tax=Flavobacterium laiguense TaxID=2169409 RepID=A0A2U1K131_9FLAO|nr:hypothetical protein [Flavobacterium laiguense]PWA10955.1 hypothetical protein DB891_03750 [Flavobacterium laiguense]